jgi:MFS family permease
VSDVGDDMRLPRNVVRLGFVSMAQDAASKLVYPILPTLIVGSLAAPPWVLGLIEGVADATSATMRLISGRLADRRRRYPFIVAGYSIAAVARLILVIATVWPMVLASRFLDRFGKGIRSAPRDALIADETPAALRGRAYGFHTAVERAGSVLGPIIGLVAWRSGMSLRSVLWLSLIPEVIAVGLTLMVRERPRAIAEPAAVGGAVSKRPSLELHGLGAHYWTSITPLIAFALVNSTDAYLLLRARALGFSVTQLFIAYLVMSVMVATLSYPVGVLTDRVGRRGAYLFGLTCFAAVYAGMAVADGVLAVLGLFALYGVYGAATDGVVKSLVVDATPSARRASGLGAYQAIAGFGSLFAGLWTGIAWGGNGAVPLAISGGGAAMVAVWVATHRQLFTSSTAAAVSATR